MKRFIHFLLGILGFSVMACDNWASEYGCPHADYEIKGKVVNEENQPLNHIQVVVQQYDTVYTDSTGQYRVQGNLWLDGQLPISVTDTDGEANGGEYDPEITTIEYNHSELQGGDNKWYKGKLSKEIDFKLKKKE